MSVKILGVRHHGAGSAQYVQEVLKQLKPDLILVEGPPEMEAMARWVGDKALKPPVAVLCYDQENTEQAAFYPFAVYSPEWVALAYANNKQVPFRMMDLPLAIRWQMDREIRPDAATTEDATEMVGATFEKSPLAYFAELAGYDNSDLWWEDLFENRYLPKQAEAHFEAVLLTMQTLRESGLPSALDAENHYREAYMAQYIREAQQEMYSNIVVVCGAWHAPALLDLEKTEAEHYAILNSLPKSKVKVDASWVPWTNERLTWWSGYGAGIESPGWYNHLWDYPKDTRGVQWLAGVARLFRNKKVDVSTAHVIEAARLAESLAALRERARPGLWELNEATIAVMCMGEAIQMELLKKELIVGRVIGKVPKDLPKLPLHADFEQYIDKLRLPQPDGKKFLELDLRKDIDLRRSIFFFRLNVLEVNWAFQTGVRSRGTFKEGWELKWRAEVVLQIVDKGIWGNTFDEAANKFLISKADASNSIADLSEYIRQAIPAELFVAIDHLLLKINELSAVVADIQQLMAAIGPLSHVSRYGNVRGTDLQTVGRVVESMLLRVCVGLPTACYGMDEQSAQSMFKLIRSVHDAVRLIENPELMEQWQGVLKILADKEGIPAIIRGCTGRLLFDAQVVSREETAIQFGLALSNGTQAIESAAWLEGFLSGSGTILIFDPHLWNLLYRWMAELEDETFQHMLPILRRTFAHFPAAERKQIGEKARHGTENTGKTNDQNIDYQEFDKDQGLSVLPVMAQIFGLK